MSTDPHVLSTQEIPYGISPIYPRGQKPQAQVQEIKSDSLYFQKKLKNGWHCRFDLNESGKLTMTASKTIGRLVGSDEANISIAVETTEQRAPTLKKVGYASDDTFVEVNDGLNRTTESFKTKNKSYETNETYKRQYHASSVLTVDEFFSEMIPNFEEILTEKKMDEYAVKISESASKVQAPYNRNYVVEK